jgi:hypothetical protein
MKLVAKVNNAPEQKDIYMPNVLEFDSPLLVKILLGVTDILGS